LISYSKALFVGELFFKLTEWLRMKFKMRTGLLGGTTCWYQDCITL